MNENSQIKRVRLSGYGIGIENAKMITCLLEGCTIHKKVLVGRQGKFHQK